jgi:hypothetical protein
MEKLNKHIQWDDYFEKTHGSQKKGKGGGGQKTTVGRGDK